MTLQVFGISHKTAPIEIRERLAIGEDLLPSALESLTADPGVNEAAILSTCNRTELYCDVDDLAKGHALNWIVRYQALDPQLIASHSYTFNEQTAVQHALKVACGLDSMVLGEPQIFGQLKQAYRAASGHGAAGSALHKLFQFSFHIAKQIRHETAIGENPVSVAYAAAKLAQQIHGDLAEKNAVLVGAGDTITLVANHLRGIGIRSLIIANRTLSRAQELATAVDGETIPFENLSSTLSRADVVVSSTGSRQAVITKHMVENAIEARDGEPIFLVDLAVPRDVDPHVEELEDAYLYTVDDLNHVVSENAKARANAARQAEELIERQSLSYLQWAGDGNAKDVITEIRRHTEQLKQDALAKAAKRLEAGDPPHEVLNLLAHTLSNRILHQPMKALREAPDEGDQELVRIARLLLGKNS
ncbi:MAG: glutamyl-tRNA reductase [Gammaproteobacteria bacterium]